MKKKIIFIAAHRFNRSPSQRYRFEQYFSFLKENGFDCQLANIISAADDKIFYSQGNWLKKILLLLKFFLKRCWHVIQSFQYDYIFIQREAFFIGPPLFEYLFKLTGKKIIFDLDDAIWLPNVSEGNKQFAKLKFPKKVAAIMRLSSRIVAGNIYLKAYASQFNHDIVIIPSTIDLNYYKIIPQPDSTTVTIGWSGSATTIQHFKTLENVFEKLKEKFGDKINFMVYGDENYEHEGLKLKGIKWTSESEVEVLNRFDIGVMPLPDNEWTRGKCAMKALQYMALAKPVVVSPVGVNKDIIIEGVNGFWAATDEEWVLKLEQLINNAALRKSIGEAGKNTIEKDFSVAANGKKYVTVFNF